MLSVPEDHQSVDVWSGSQVCAPFADLQRRKDVIFQVPTSIWFVFRVRVLILSQHIAQNFSQVGQRLQLWAAKDLNLDNPLHERATAGALMEGGALPLS